MADLIPTRRAMLAGMVAVPALAIAGCPASAPATPNAGGILAAIATARRASAISSAYHRRVYEPIYERVQAQLGAVPPTIVSYRDGADLPRELHTGDDFSDWMLAHYRKDTPHMVSAQPGWMQDAVRMFDAGETAREAERSRIREASGLDRARDRSDALGNAACAALDAVAVAPVTSLTELVEKIAYLRERDWWEDEPAELIDDVLRLAGEGR